MSRARRRTEPEDDHEQFFERMALAQELEELLEALYRDFLSIRLSARWPELVRPALRSTRAARRISQATCETLPKRGSYWTLQ
jgi:hypothetical protein